MKWLYSTCFIRTFFVCFVLSFKQRRKVEHFNCISMVSISLTRVRSFLYSSTSDFKIFEHLFLSSRFQLFFYISRRNIFIKKKINLNKVILVKFQTAIECKICIFSLLFLKRRKIENNWDISSFVFFFVVVVAVFFSFCLSENKI